jgi:hypothetical protein
MSFGKTVYPAFYLFYRFLSFFYAFFIFDFGLFYSLVNELLIMPLYAIYDALLYCIDVLRSKINLIAGNLYGIRKCRLSLSRIWDVPETSQRIPC